MSLNGCCRYLTAQLPGPNQPNRSSSTTVRPYSDSRSVRTELSATKTPQLVRTWVANLPEWIEVSSAARRDDVSLSRLHLGERDAISLALEVRADAVLIDERHGRQEAEKRDLRVIGTLGVLTAAYARGLIDLIAAIDSLRQTTFHISPKLLASIALKYRDK